MIEQFRGKYGWLSNFHDVDIKYKGRIFPSVEHAYLSAKCDDEGWKDLCAEYGQPAGDLKKVSKGLPLVDNWSDIKLGVMKTLLEIKFNQEPFRSKLIKTGDTYIQEGNTWGDIFWGVDLKHGYGENYLGRLIMGIRETLIK